MVIIRPLEHIEWADLDRIMPGYTSAEKYAVVKIEADERTTISLQLVALDTPYTRRWDHRTEGNIENLQRVLKEQLSLGAYDDGELVGLAIAERHDWHRTLWIWEFGIAASHRRRGIGRQLMDALVADARAEGLRIMVAETQNTNVPAIRFYRAAGFALDALDLSYYTNSDVTDFEVAIFMKRKL
jgi:ribosomal protein S18 acetylase RimI-like enzyme